MLYILLGVLHVPHKWEERVLEISGKVTSNREVMLGDWGVGDSSELRNRRTSNEMGIHSPVLGTG